MVRGPPRDLLSEPREWAALLVGKRPSPSDCVVRKERYGSRSSFWDGYGGLTARWWGERMAGGGRRNWSRDVNDTRVPSSGVAETRVEIKVPDADHTALGKPSWMLGTGSTKLTEQKKKANLHCRQGGVRGPGGTRDLQNRCRAGVAVNMTGLRCSSGA